MKIIDGKNAVLGRLASYTAKELLKGEEIVILNCEEIIITGNKKDIKEKFDERKRKIGSGQQGPKHSGVSEKIVKRAIRGMIPKNGRGAISYKKLKCYKGIPIEFKEKKKIVGIKKKKSKFITIKDLSKNG